MEKKILVIEDELQFAKTLNMLLEKKGFNTDIASDMNINPFLEKINKGKISYNIILFDLNIPGIDVAKEIGSINKNCPDSRVIVISGTDPDVVKEILGTELEYNFLQKPFGVKELLEAIK